jgi:hypothetical protein
MSSRSERLEGRGRTRPVEPVAFRSASLTELSKKIVRNIAPASTKLICRWNASSLTPAAIMFRQSRRRRRNAQAKIRRVPSITMIRVSVLELHTT